MQSNVWLGWKRATTIALIAAVGACKDVKQEIARRSEAEMPAHLRDAREGASRFATGFVALVDALAPSVSAPMAAHDVEGVRFALIGMSTQSTPAGSLAFFPTGFVVAIGPDGVAVARNIDGAQDRMRGMNVEALFPNVRAALDGHASLGVGELPPTSDQPSRVFAIAAAPVRGARGEVLGALAAGVSYGQFARSLDTTVRVRAGQGPVVWVGLERGGRVLPAGQDRDVPPRWLVPAELTRTVPRDASARLERGHGMFAYSFVQDERGWGGGVATIAELGDTRVLVFRSEARQR